MPRFRIAAVLLLCLGGFRFACAETFQVDPAHTSVVFAVNHLGMSYVYGRFNTVAGQFVLDQANPAGNGFQMNIDASSLDTNNAKRDEHLRGPDFFNVKQFPVITFASTQVTPSEDGFALSGNVTIHGVTKPITIPLQLLGSGQGPDGPRAGFLTNFTLNRSDFGMNNMQGPIGDEVMVLISFEGVQQQ